MGCGNSSHLRHSVFEPGEAVSHRTQESPQEQQCRLKVPLLYACGKNDIGTVQDLTSAKTSMTLLLEADPDSGDTPLGVAAERGHARIVEHLLHVIATHASNAVDDNGSEEAAVEALAAAKDAVRRGLLKGNANGESPLHLATQEGHKGAFEVLFQAHMLLELDLDIRTTAGETPLLLAVDRAHEYMIDRLAKAGAQADAAAHDGGSPIRVAKYGGLPLVEALYGHTVREAHRYLAKQEGVITGDITPRSLADDGGGWRNSRQKLQLFLERLEARAGRRKTFIALQETGFSKVQAAQELLGVEETQSYTKLFNTLDTDHSGNVDVHEFMEVMAAHGAHISAEDASRAVRNADCGGDGKFDLGDFLVLVALL